MYFYVGAAVAHCCKHPHDAWSVWDQSLSVKQFFLFFLQIFPIQLGTKNVLNVLLNVFKISFLLVFSYGSGMLSWAFISTTPRLV